jgi:metallophosphoesterase (TIGR03767 family)
VNPTRRRVLGAGALAATGLVAFPSRGSATAPLVAPRGTTLDRTLVLGPAGRGGYKPVVGGPAEPHIVRSDLGGTVANASVRARRRRPLLAFAQFSDIHVLDSQSPARVEFLDRLSDPDGPLAGAPLTASACRPQETMTLQVAEAMVAAVNRIRRAPATGMPLAFTICTGDNVDNAQLNEVRWMIDVLDGGYIRPDSGDPRRYEGVMDNVVYDTRYWHPEGNPPGQGEDLPRFFYGFPTVPGLLDAARRPFHASGLRTPWFTVFGNHDGLVQGNFPQFDKINDIAVGERKIIGLAPNTDLGQLFQLILANDPRAIDLLFAGPVRQVTADKRRRTISRAEIIKEHFRTSGTPRGHGYRRRNLETGTAYYHFDRGPLRCVALDTVVPAGGAEGSLDRVQLGWLEALLADGSSRYLNGTGQLVSARRPDRLFVLFSHHTIATMTNGNLTPGEQPRALGPEVRDLLLRFPNVVAWVNGHSHRNRVLAHARPPGSPVEGGFWEINTASHIDWPQQARIIEFADNRDGTLSILTTMIDSAAPESFGGRLGSPLRLAALSRELSGNDWTGRARPDPDEDGTRGRVTDRNLELIVPNPFTLRVG